MAITKTLYKEFLDLPIYAWYHLHDRDKYDWIQSDTYGSLDDPSEDDLSDLWDDTEKFFLQRYNPSEISDISQYPFEEQINATKKATKERAPVIYQWKLSTGDVYTIFDVLEYVPASDSYRHIEIKSKSSIRNKNNVGVYTSLKTDIKEDISFSSYILKKNDIPVQENCIAFLNRDYYLKWKLDTDKLFVIEPINDALISPSEIEITIWQISYLIGMNFEQAKEKYPYDGSKYKRYFAEKPPKGTIEILSSLTWDRYSKVRDAGIYEIENIPPESLEIFTDKQQSFIVRYQKWKHFESALSDRLKALEFPLFFYDYETYTSGIPRFQQSHPWQQVFCQYSIHKMEKDWDIEHFEWIIGNGKQDNRELINSMMQDLWVLSGGTFVSWNAGFENGRNKELIEKYPEYSANLRYMIDHTFDLMMIFRDGLYFDPGCQGSNSLKAVLPALTDITYEGMPVGNGMEAMRVIEKVLAWKATEKEIKDCLTYCEQDTWAMVAIYRKLLTALNP